MYVRPISERLLSGRLTPAIRATSRSPLALLVALVLADHEHHSVAADDLAFLAHRLDRRSYLHDPFRRLGSVDAALAAVAAAATGSWICSRERTNILAIEQECHGSNLDTVRLAWTRRPW